MKQGIVMKAYDEYAVVLSDEGYQKVKIGENVLQGQKLFFTEKDVYKKTVQRRNGIMTIRRFAAVAAAFVLIVMGSTFFAQEDYATIVTIDINPSVELELDEDEIVTGFQPLNEDAQQLELENVLGLKIDEAVEYITNKAAELGFINLEDLQDDYVLVTTVSENDDVETCLKEAAENNETLQKVNIAMAKATREQLEEALGAKVPLGLIVSGQLDELQEKLKVQEFFDDEELKALFEEYGFIIKEDNGHKLNRINAHLQKCENGECDAEELEEGFNYAKYEFEEAKRLYEEARERYQQALKTGTEEEIAVAKQEMEEAEKYKDLMETKKDEAEANKENYQYRYSNQNQEQNQDEDEDQDEDGNGQNQENNDNGKNGNYNGQDDEDDDQDEEDDQDEDDDQDDDEQ